MSYESYFSKRRLRNATIGAIVGFIIVFIIFIGLQIVGYLISGDITVFIYSLFTAVAMGAIMFVSIIFLPPRGKYIGPASQVETDEKVDSVVETTVEAMEKHDDHFHVKGERKEEDVLKHLEESHESSDNRGSNQD